MRYLTFLYIVFPSFSLLFFIFSINPSFATTNNSDNLQHDTLKLLNELPTEIHEADKTETHGRINIEVIDPNNIQELNKVPTDAQIVFIDNRNKIVHKGTLSFVREKMIRAIKKSSARYEKFMSNKSSAYWPGILVRASIPAGVAYLGFTDDQIASEPFLVATKMGLAFLGSFFFGVYGDEFLKILNNENKMTLSKNGISIDFQRDKNGDFIPSSSKNVYLKGFFYGEIPYSLLISLPQFLYHPTMETFYLFLVSFTLTSFITNYAISSSEAYLRQYAQAERNKLGLDEEPDIKTLTDTDLKAFLKTKSIENIGQATISSAVNGLQVMTTAPDSPELTVAGNIINIFIGALNSQLRNQLLKSKSGKRLTLKERFTNFSRAVSLSLSLSLDNESLNKKYSPSMLRPQYFQMGEVFHLKTISSENSSLNNFSTPKNNRQCIPHYFPN